MCVRILESAHQVNSEEWQFFLKGGQVLDRSQQPPNPAPAWMSGLAWDNITQLDNLPNFKVLGHTPLSVLTESLLTCHDYAHASSTSHSCVNLCPLLFDDKAE